MLNMMRFATVQCFNPSCHAVYDAAVESGYHAECPACGQLNRVAGQAMSKEITGLCDACMRPLDEHVFGRTSYACPPKGASK
jgi:hypothetical protein